MTDNGIRERAERLVDKAANACWRAGCDEKDGVTRIQGIIERLLDEIVEQGVLVRPSALRAERDEALAPFVALAEKWRTPTAPFQSNEPYARGQLASKLACANDLTALLASPSDWLERHDVDILAERDAEWTHAVIGDSPTLHDPESAARILERHDAEVAARATLALMGEEPLLQRGHFDATGKWVGEFAVTQSRASLEAALASREGATETFTGEPSIREEGKLHPTDGQQTDVAERPAAQKE